MYCTSYQIISTTRVRQGKMRTKKTSPRPKVHLNLTTYRRGTLGTNLSAPMDLKVAQTRCLGKTLQPTVGYSLNVLADHIFQRFHLGKQLKAIVGDARA
jgi:hypothetical protein|tara:strand:- start:72 stop:368 length:297 start_codon:yes stop_codon:yes gene_type:complete